MCGDWKRESKPRPEREPRPATPASATVCAYRYNVYGIPLYYNFTVPITHFSFYPGSYPYTAYRRSTSHTVRVT